jgi:hypothetical protein
MDAFSDPWFTLHQSVEIMRVEHKEAGAGHGENGGRTPSPAQGCDFTEKMSRTETSPREQTLDRTAEMSAKCRLCCKS